MEGQFPGDFESPNLSVSSLPSTNSMKEIEGYIIPVLNGHNLIQVANFIFSKKGSGA